MHTHSLHTNSRHLPPGVAPPSNAHDALNKAGLRQKGNGWEFTLAGATVGWQWQEGRLHLNIDPGPLPVDIQDATNGPLEIKFGGQVVVGLAHRLTLYTVSHLVPKHPHDILVQVGEKEVPLSELIAAYQARETLGAAAE